MNEEQRKKLIETLISFIEHACTAGSDAEIAVLPDTVRELRILSYDE